MKLVKDRRLCRRIKELNSGFRMSSLRRKGDWRFDRYVLAAWLSVVLTCRLCGKLSRRLWGSWGLLHHTPFHSLAFAHVHWLRWRRWCLPGSSCSSRWGSCCWFGDLCLARRRRAPFHRLRLLVILDHSLHHLVELCRPFLLLRGLLVHQKRCTLWRWRHLHRFECVFICWWGHNLLDLLLYLLYLLLLHLLDLLDWSLTDDRGAARHG